MRNERNPKNTGIRIRTILIGGSLLLGLGTNAQLAVTPQADVAQLASSLAGHGVQIANPVINCHGQGFGQFAYTGTLLGIEQGVLLTTGTITNATGPNNVENRTFEQNTPGDALLTQMSGRTTLDACRLEFDLIPGGDSLRLGFALGSEEYNEWVGSQFNDVFAITISGPGIPGDPGMGSDHNMAMVPGTGQPVMINTVNNGSNQAYFHDNTGGSQLQYDGLARNLTAKVAVQPCATYRLKFIIADVTDRLYDSGLFLAPVSSNAVTLSSFTASGLPYVVEGCNNGNVRFTRNNSGSQPLTVTYYLGGDAINGNDYALVGGNPDPLVPKTVVIPTGQNSVDISINAIADGIPEGSEIVRVWLGSSICPGSHLDSLDLMIRDAIDVQISSPQTICSGQNVSLTASGGASYAWNPASGLSSSSSASTIASPVVSTTYTVTVAQGACSATASTAVTVEDLQLDAIISRPLCQGGANGLINLDVAGGQAPYTFAWSGPNGFNSTNEDLVNIGSGTYTVQVTSATGCTRVQSFNVGVPATLGIILQTSILPYGQNIACHGSLSGSIDLNITGGTAPYSFSWSGPNGYTSTMQSPSGLGAGSYSVSVTDQNGCIALGTITLTQPPPLAPLIDEVLQVTCPGGSNGVAPAVITGGIPPYSYLWNTSPPQTGATASNLAAGTYLLTVTDGYGCTAASSITIQQPVPLTIKLAGFNHVLHCQGQSSQHGTATAVVGGGTGPYTYFWNTFPAQTTETATFPAGGSFSVTVTDANGCTASLPFTVNQPGQPVVTVPLQTNITCFGTSSGTATVAISGGSNVQTVIWNTTPPQSGFTATNLPAGSYIVTMQHSNGCQSQAQVTIQGPPAPLTPSFPQGAITPVSCHGGSDGSAAVSMSGGTAPYSFLWNTSPLQTTATATNLEAGTYNLTVTDANGCTATSTATIPAPSAPVQASITAFTNVLCFGSAQGTATASASGGTPPYLYSWDTAPPQSGALASDLAAGIHVVNVTDANGCSAATSVTIGGPQFGINASFNDVHPETCFGASDGQATITVTGGSNAFTIIWDTQPPTSGTMASGLAPGTYMVLVTDDNGCDSPQTYSVDITGSAATLEIAIQSEPAACSTSLDGAIDLTVTGGEAPYAISWSDANGNSWITEDLGAIPSGAYEVLVEDAHGCIVTSSVMVPTTEALGVDITVAQVVCDGSSNGSLMAQIDGGNLPITISWNGPNGYNSGQSAIDQLGPGNYSVVVSDGSGCSVSASTLLENVSTPTLTLDPMLHPGGTAVACAGGSDGAVDLTISNGVAPFAIQWTDGLGFFGSDEDISGVASGVYQVTVTDVNGCSAQDLIALTAPPPLDLTASSPNANGYNIGCVGGSDGSIDITVSGGAAPYVYLWDNGAEQEDISGLSTGNHTLGVMDANGCKAWIDVTLTAPPGIELSIITPKHPGNTSVSCPGASDGTILTTIIGGIPPYTILWTGPGGYTSTDASITDLIAGSYMLTVTDANGCSTSTTIALDEPAPMSANLTSTTYNGGYNIACAGNNSGDLQVQILQGLAPFTYAWTGPGGFTASGSSQTALATGTYQVVATDANGCTAMNSFDLLEAPQLEVYLNASELMPGIHVGCNGDEGSITVNLVGGTAQHDFSWTGPGGFGSMLQNLTDLGAGTYQLVVTDANGCSNTQSLSLNAPSPIQAVFESTAVICPGEASGTLSAILSGGLAPHTLQWSGPQGFTANDIILGGLESGLFELQVTDALGCLATFSVSVGSPAPLGHGAYVSFYGQYNLQCTGDSSGVIELTPYGGSAPYTVLATGPNGYQSASLDHTGLIAGTYVITVTDANGCTLEDQVILLEPTLPMETALSLSVYPSGTNVSCHGGSDGWIEANVVGGSGPYTFIWRGPDSLEYNTPLIEGLSAGNYLYEIVVTDANQCTFFTEVTLTEPDQPLTASSVLSDYNGGVQVSCPDAENGSIALTTTGGNPGYTYSWIGPADLGSTAEVIDGLPVGNYTVTITDINGCTLQATHVLGSSDPITAVLDVSTFPSGSHISCHGANDGSIVASISGGVPWLQFEWSGPNGINSNAAELEGLTPGTYCLTIGDANGCTTQFCTTLVSPDVLTASANVQNAACGNANGAADVMVNGGSTPYVYAWSNGVTTAGLSGLQPGSFTVVVSDVNGCSTNAQATVTGTPGVSMTGVTTHIACATENTGSIQVQLTNGVAPFTYAWSNGAAFEDLENMAAGTYDLVATDANGCMANGSWTIQQNAALTIAYTVPQHGNGYAVSSFLGQNGSITTTIDGGTPPYSFLWSNGSTTHDLSGLAAGAYSLQVTDMLGCTASLSLTLDQPNDLQMPSGFSPNDDGANDAFIIRGLDGYARNSFVVMNRWGTVVFEQINYRNDWRGANNVGQALPDGTYFVLLTVNEGTRDLQGYVDLRR